MTSNPTGFANPKCYASALNDCSLNISREHSVSAGILKAISPDQKTVEVSGKLWMSSPDVCKKLGINSLAGSILCERHNNALSRFDSAGVNFFTAVLDMHETFHKRIITEIHTFPGPDIERWLLKTLCGLIVSGDTGVLCGNERIRLTGWKPPTGWLRILFANSPFPDHCGLYVSSEKGLTPQTTGDTILKVAPIVDAEQNVIGFQAGLFYHDLLLLMDASYRFAPRLTVRTLHHRPAIFLFEDVKGLREVKLGLKWGGHPFSDVTIRTTIFPQPTA